MSVTIYNEKSIGQIKEEEEEKKIDLQADIYEIVANLYEELENVKVRVKALEGGAK
ncbi:hypothetical protein CLPU_6c00530 [Gottschalkia purinilytica]|uniref:Uncharacterized protein n=1 Tax=Gottschalkia purinilytica TaxID=1503 RepID=A0A0L0WAU7_GOTPU|nr:hypothetical protein [Gottschalkia purinilytica]KNF08567.1 hypothetical protein CLPU_6c00530 [Gottschalkia purinilytica]